MTCVVCSSPLPPPKRMGRPRKVCSPRCHNWKRTHGDEPPRWVSPRLCEHCGGSVTSSDIRVRYCTSLCARRAAAKSQVGRLGSGRRCRYCDEVFQIDDNRQVYCSVDCRIRYNSRFGSASNLRRQAVKRGAILEGRFSLVDVARRDGWVCMLCFGLIDPEVRDRYFQATIDHIVPITAGGAHSFANVQLAHWTCNTAKRDSTDVLVMSVPNRDEKRVILRGRSGQDSEAS